MFIHVDSEWHSYRNVCYLCSPIPEQSITSALTLEIATSKLQKQREGKGVQEQRVERVFYPEILT